MGINRIEQTKRGQVDTEPTAELDDRGVFKKSGVLPQDLVAELRRVSQAERWRPGEDPPWSVVESYLAYGAYHAEIEEHARRSRVFAFVLETLRSEAEEARDDDRDPPSAGPPTTDSRSPPRSQPLRLVR